MAVLKLALTLLDPIIVAVGLATDWLSIDAPVKVHSIA